MRAVTRLRALFLIALAACRSTAALGYEENALEQHRVPEIVVTATRNQHDAFEIPRAVSVIDVGFQGDLLPELLRGQTGMFVQQTTPGQGTPIVRGLIGSSVLILVDGMRLNNAMFRPAPNQYMALVDPYDIERIEVLRGSGSALFGSDAMGGVINLLTATPTFSGDDWETGGAVAGHFDTADLGRSTHARLSFGKRGISVTGGATYVGHEDLRTGAGRVQPTAYDAYAAHGNAFVERDTWDLLFKASYLRQPKTPRIDELIAGFGQENPSSEVFNFQPNDRLFFHLRHRVDTPFLFVERLETHIAFQEINDDRRTRNFGSTEEQRSFNRSRYIAITLQAASTPSPRTHLDYGIDTYLDRVASSARARNTVTGAVEPARTRFANGSRQSSLGVFIQGEVDLTESLVLMGGGRVSYFALRIPQADRDVGTKRDIAAFSGQVSLVYRASRSVRLVTNLGRGFRAPNVFDLSTLGPRPGDRFNIPNPDLGSEEIWSFDIGAKMRTENLEGSIFGFYSKLDDRIAAAATGEQSEDGRIVVQSQNIASTDLAGVETQARLYLGSLAEVDSSLSYVWGEQDTPGRGVEPADRVPPLTGRLVARVAVTENVTIGAGLVWAGKQSRLSGRDHNDPRINPRGTRGWLNTQLSAGLRISSRASLSATINNLLDHRYREHGSGIDARGIGFRLTGAVRY